MSQSKQHLVSVIIPTFNRPEFLKIALDSALRQTYTAFEVIVTDDSTNFLICEYIKSIPDSRIRYYKNDKQLGIAANTRQGILLSQGTFFCFLNDDDCWHEHFLEMMMAIASKYETAGCIFCDHWLINSRGNILKEQTDINTIHYKRKFLKQGLIPAKKKINMFLNFSVPIAMACMLKRAFIDIENYPLEIGGAYDRWILLQCVKNNECDLAYLDKRLTYYRVHDASVTAKHPSSVIKAVIFILNRARIELQLNSDQKKRLNKGLRSCIRNFIKNDTIKVSYLYMYLRTYFS